MARQIYLVNAYVVDANGNFSIPQGYPKSFDSANYAGDVAKARKRAEGDFSEVKGAMCKVDTRQLQTVVLTDVTGFELDRWTDGFFPDEE